MSSSVACPDSRRQINAIAANAAMSSIHLTPRLRRDVSFFFSTRREFPPARDGCSELLGTRLRAKEATKLYLREDSHVKHLMPDTLDTLPCSKGVGFVARRSKVCLAAGGVGPAPFSFRDPCYAFLLSEAKPSEKT